MTLHGAHGAGGADALLTVLELLARQAPAARFEGLVDEARATGADAAELDRLERAVALAAEVRAGRERDARREAGLATLTDTARDLTLSYDLDSLLRVITRRARRLLGLDLAYVTLRGPHGASYVHTTEGTRGGRVEGPRLAPGLRIAEGYGLGGAVQLHGEPVWTADYLADERFAPSGSLDAGVHAPAFDESAEAALRAEDLHAIMAAPLRSGDTVIGALHGADRHVRDHTPEEIGLLAALADLAALAVEKAGLLDRTRAEVSELERDSSRVRTSLTRMRHVSEAHGRIMNLVLAGGDLCNVAKAAADALDATVMIRDQGGRCLATAGDIPGLDEEAVAKASLDAHARRRPVLADDDTWVAPVIAGSEDLGGLVIRAAGGLTGEDERLLELSAQSVAFLLLMRRSTAVAEGPVRDELLDDLIADPPHAPQQIAQRARRLGVDLRKPHVLVLARPEGGEQGRAVVWASSYAYRLSGLKTVQGGCIVLLLPGIDASAAAKAVAAELSPLLGHPVSVAAAGPGWSPDGVARMHQEAGRCLDAMSALGGTGSAASVQDLGFLGLLLSDDNDVDGFVEAAIGPVLDYDAERFTDLTHTLEAYFASGGSPTNAAEALHVHPNTVSRRLERIGELLGPEWQKPGQVLEVQLALRLQRTREVLARGRAAADPARQPPGPPERTT
ncbi:MULTISPECIES: helix-turn-helix domain-containing protein [Streptomyces]|uniref:GAF domain protein n=1 Tax=Streptomyces venezuelae (strain ATCC 10712 / CBS 650.69 / DSM 40230 / JCM 4526 / NBRC 13096 / PD 04745) TaxID=953739 RepID=F2R3G0_STRVP|nr:helix-turn-helix domain-containing protein [Streptomyces venezuelae]APE21730.1 transcriptional regulator [Streptomyces venezuelae]QER99114.1 GAF domain-containing protein [Streptomyces venezuelae ATCC 10712]QES15070.1 transcriptional regulator [Streptomyces venezuelae]CCA55802.1 GAF domain protein [Streptomyces venezuelae ATCC 10712]